MTDLSPLRARFPSLSREGPDGRPMLFADAPGGSQVPESVIEAMVAYLRTSNSNTHGSFDTSRETDEVIEGARRAGADMTGADPDEIVLGPERDDAPDGSVSLVRRGRWDPATRSSSRCSTTTRTCAVDARRRGRRRHRAMGRHPRRRRHARPRLVRRAPCPIARALVAFTLASNAVGTIPQAADLVRRAHAAGALVARRRRAPRAAPLARRARRSAPTSCACSPVQVLRPAPRHAGRPPRAARRVARRTRSGRRPTRSPSVGRPARRTTRAWPGLAAAVDYLAGARARVRRARRRHAPRRGRRRFDAIVAHERELALRLPGGPRAHAARAAVGHRATRRASANGRRRSRSASASSTPPRPPRSSAAEAFLSGTATTTRSR